MRAGVIFGIQVRSRVRTCVKFELGLGFEIEFGVCLGLGQQSVFRLWVRLALGPVSVLGGELCFMVQLSSWICLPFSQVC